MKYAIAVLATAALVSGPAVAQQQTSAQTDTSLPHPCKSASGSWTLCIGDTPIDTTGNKADLAHESQEVTSALAPLRAKITEFVQTERQAAGGR